MVRFFGMLWLVLFASCGGIDSRAVLLDPLDVVLPKGGIQVFVARVIGGDGSGVDWSVDEEERGGRITTGGVYTAPTVEGRITSSREAIRTAARERAQPLQ